MTYSTSNFFGIRKELLNIDNQAYQCVLMVCGLWSLLTISTTYSACLSIRYMFPTISLNLLIPIVTIFGLSIFSVLFALYRHLICLSLFSTNPLFKPITSCEMYICLITTITWIPNMMFNLVGDLSIGFSLKEIVTFNNTGFAFLLLCMSLLIIINIVSTYALLISTKRLRRISRKVYCI